MVGQGPRSPMPIPPIANVLQSSPKFNDSHEFQRSPENFNLKLFTKVKLNDLVKDLSLTEEKVWLSCSRLKEKHAASIYYYSTKVTMIIFID